MGNLRQGLGRLRAYAVFHPSNEKIPFAQLIGIADGLLCIRGAPRFYFMGPPQKDIADIQMRRKRDASIFARIIPILWKPPDLCLNERLREPLNIRGITQFQNLLAFRSCVRDNLLKVYWFLEIYLTNECIL